MQTYGEYLHDHTNQQAEIIAAALGLEALKETCQVKLISDSQYVIKTMKGEFRRKTNHEYWKRLDQAASIHKVQWSGPADTPDIPFRKSVIPLREPSPSAAL